MVWRRMWTRPPHSSRAAVSTSGLAGLRGYVIHHHGFAGASVAVRLLEATLDARGDAVRAGEWALVLEVAPERRGDARAGAGSTEVPGRASNAPPRTRSAGTSGWDVNVKELSPTRSTLSPDADVVTVARPGWPSRHANIAGVSLNVAATRQALRWGSREKSIPPARAIGRAEPDERRGRSTRRARSILA